MNEDNLKRILILLKGLTYSELEIVHQNLLKHVYAKGLEDYIQAQQIYKNINQFYDTKSTK